MVADQPGLIWLALWRSGEQRIHEVVVAVRLVDKASAVTAHCNETRLGAVDQVREMPSAAIAARHLRYRRPGTGMGQGGGDLGANLLSQAQAIAAVFRRCGRVMANPIGRVRHQLRDALAVMGKAATGQHHATPRLDLLAIGTLRAADACTSQQGNGRFVGQQRDAQVEGAAQQAGHQRVTVDQLQTAPVQQQVAAVAQQAFGHMPSRPGRLASIEESGHVRATCNAHAGQADDVQRWPQPVYPGPEQAAVIGQCTQCSPPAGAAVAFTHVGQFRTALELHAGVLLEERHHCRAMAQERTLACVQFSDAGLGTQVALWCIVGFDQAFGHGQWVARYPQPTARPGAGAA
ncbi:hypothetical protein D3C81_1146520 [compost metagenome]